MSAVPPTTRPPLITDDHEQPDRQTLEAELARARQQLERLEAEYNVLLTDSSTLQEDRDSTRMLLDGARRQVLVTEATLAQLDSGGYGTCAACGGVIPPERLEALPGVTTCVSCQGRR